MVSAQSGIHPGEQDTQSESPNLSQTIRPSDSLSMNSQLCCPADHIIELKEK